MPIATARSIVDHVFLNSPENEKIEFGFFGGEPLLQLDLIKSITEYIRGHERYSPERVTLTITTNGTIFNEEVSEFLVANSVVLCISCDGPQSIQDRYRHFRNGTGSSLLVEKNIRNALQIFPSIPVNAVYSPETLQSLPDVVDYLVSLGVERIFLNPDISAHWTQKDADSLPRVFDRIGEMYLGYHLEKKPKYVSVIDGKIAVILRGGYRPMEKCRMGDHELAFAPSGNVYPCERLIGSDDGTSHCLGNINDGIELKRRCRHIPTEAVNSECLNCGLDGYCMNWCGCTNYAMAGRYDKAAPFLCASERAAIYTAMNTLRLANENHINLSHGPNGADFASATCII